MTDPGADRHLHELFAQLKNEDRALVSPPPPSVRSMMSQRASRGHTSHRRLALPLAVAAGLVIAVTLGTFALKWDISRLAHDELRLQGTILSASWWTSPTDFLLATPGSDMLRTVPAFGWTEEWPAGSTDWRSTPDSTRFHLRTSS